MQERKLNIGMIGAGFIGQLAHLMNYAEVKRCRVTALAEYRPELRRKVAQRYDIPRTYATHTEMLRDPEVDACIVVTPRPYTAPVALDCLKAGKHVLTEKPMAGTSEQALELVEEAAARKLHYVVGYMKRHDEGVQLAKRMLDDVVASGELGPIQFVRAHCYMGDSYCKADGHVVTDEKPEYSDAGLPMAPSFLPTELAKPYARFVNCFSHNTNLLRHLFGRTPRVDYANVSGSVGQVAILDFGPFVASLETGDATNRGWDEVTEVFFKDGCLTLRTPPALLKNVAASVELYKAGGVQQIVKPQPNWTWAFRRQAEAFVADILDVKPAMNAGSDAIEELRLIENIWRADLARTRR
ncbi:MAG: Gfo/Idh/MocA family oxidoreductase [Planctomycetota bacterium]|nr:Gfo/Idh/MocA family oxidoreductase [Planctomycetota bacterium]